MPPVLSVVNGNPTADEIAALVAVLAARTLAGPGGARQGPRSAWSSKSALMRAPVTAAPGAWRASALPG
ncbi:MAG TPA: acyl-CoA carboxylase epsilon subunit [Streptosporangiaceae bacterium]|jgi:hypothetical protein